MEDLAEIGQSTIECIGKRICSGLTQDLQGAATGRLAYLPPPPASASAKYRTAASRAATAHYRLQQLLEIPSQTAAACLV